MSDSTHPDRISVTCPKCGKISHTAASNIGLSAHCKCGESFVVSESHIAACPRCGELTSLETKRCPMCHWDLRGSKPKRPGQPVSVSPKMADDSSPFRDEKFVRRGLKKRKPIIIIVCGVLAIVGFLAWDRWEREVVKHNVAAYIEKEKRKEREREQQRLEVSLEMREINAKYDKTMQELIDKNKKEFELWRKNAPTVEEVERKLKKQLAEVELKKLRKQLADKP